MTPSLEVVVLALEPGSLHQKLGCWLWTMVVFMKHLNSTRSRGVSFTKS